jgi:phosphoadenosine phosphosulfate reductase
MSAIDLYNKPSADFDAKVANSIALLQRAAAQYLPTQASSLGAEDIVVTT